MDLVDIFGLMNEVNLTIQGNEVTIMDATERIKAFSCQTAAVEKEVGDRKLRKFSSVRSG